MRLLSARLRDYRLHRDCNVAFDPHFTVIAGPNQSGKSTLAEALHRALFLPVKTGGELLKAMQSDPFLAEPEVELAFEAGGQRWELRKRFAGARGSVVLKDSGGRNLQGDEAEERLAQLIGTAAVARNRGAADQLKDRWGHLWVWQGMASSNPLALGASGYDHDRLVERLQAGAELGVQSPLDLAVIDAIEQRYGEVFTAGGANRAPQVKRGSALQLARAAVADAQDELEAISARIAQQAEAEQAYQAAAEQLERLAQEQPELQRQRQALDQQLNRDRELEAELAKLTPLLAAAQKEHAELSADQQLLTQQTHRVAELEAAKAPDTDKLEALSQQLPELETALQSERQQLDALHQASTTTTAAVTALEARQQRLSQQQQQATLQTQLAALEATEARELQISRDLEALPALTAKDVEQLRRLEAAVREARVRADALATGIEVIRAGVPVRLDGSELAAGSSHLLSEPALLQVGDEVELRLLPGGGISAAEASQAVEAAQQALAAALKRLTLQTVEEAATAERRRSDLLAEQERLRQQAGAGDAASLRTRLQQITTALEAQAQDPADAAPTAETLAERLQQLEQELRQARLSRDAASQAEQKQRQLLLQREQEREALKQAIEAGLQGLRDRDNQLLEARTRVDAVLKRRGTQQALQAALLEQEQRRAASQQRLDALQAEREALGTTTLNARAQQLEQQIKALALQERQATEARIRAESQLQGDGQRDLQAELEQKQAELESCAADQERLEKEAGMLQLLRRLLAEEQNAMGSQYTGPLSERVGRYLAQVFAEAPQPSLSYEAKGGGFQDLQWRRGHEAMFRFDVLSTGAREQFAAAVRVAMAEVLAEAYDGCLPVLFDDAFANSDPERQAGVYRMLQAAAAQGLQVILLTCDPERSQGIAGASQIRLASGPASS